MLRALLSEAQRDELTLTVFQEFTEERRRLLRRLVDRALKSGARFNSDDLDVVVDTVFGALCYRLAVGHRPIDERYARAVVHELMKPAVDSKD